MYSTASIKQINIISIFLCQTRTLEPRFSHRHRITQHSTLLYLLKSVLLRKGQQAPGLKTSTSFDLHSLIHIMTALVGVTQQPALVRNLHFTMPCNGIFELIELCTSPWLCLRTKWNHSHCWKLCKVYAKSQWQPRTDYIYINHCRWENCDIVFRVCTYTLYLLKALLTASTLKTKLKSNKLCTSLHIIYSDHITCALWNSAYQVFDLFTFIFSIVNLLITVVVPSTSS